MLGGRPAAHAAHDAKGVSGRRLPGRHLSLALRAICNMKNLIGAPHIAFRSEKRLVVALGSKLGPFIFGWPEARQLRMGRFSAWAPAAHDASAAWLSPLGWQETCQIRHRSCCRINVYARVALCGGSAPERGLEANCRMVVLLASPLRTGGRRHAPGIALCGGELAGQASLGTLQARTGGQGRCA